MKDLVSIIIPTYNSERTIGKCLESIMHQTYTRFEIIVVDNNSTDRTKEIAQRYTNNVFNQGPERTAQKNFGIEKSKGKYVFFVDSDMELTEKVVEKCVEMYKNNEEVGGICIPERSIGEGLFVKIRDFERSFYKGTSVDSARFFLGEDVKKMGGFEEDLIFFEESLLPQKIETKLGKSTKFYISEYTLHNEGDIQLGKWLSKKFYYGKSLEKYTKKVKEIGIQETGNGQTGIIRRYMIFLKQKRFYIKPLLALGVLTLKTCEFGAGALGLVSSKIKKWDIGQIIKV